VLIRNPYAPQGIDTAEIIEGSTLAARLTAHRDPRNPVEP
jgi:hypothetical protein